MTRTIAFSGVRSLLTPSATMRSASMSRPGVGLVEDGELRLQHGHLQNLVALLLAAREALVDRARHQARVHLDDLRALGEQVFELQRVEFLLAAVLALLVVGEPQELRVRHARHLDRVLEGEKDALTRALVRREFEQIPPLEQHLALRHLVGRVPGEHLRQRGLPRAVRPHDGVNLALVNRQVDTAKNLFAFNRRMQISNL